MTSLLRYVISRFRSFGYATRGCLVLLRTQPNARIHLLATLIVLAAGAALGISLVEWVLVIAAITAVWVAEALNTSVEFVVDLLSPEIRPLARHAKDVAAGAVLLSAVGSAVIGILIFGPRLLILLK